MINYLLKGKCKLVHLQDWRENNEAADVIGFINKRNVHFHTHYNKDKFLEGICVAYGDNDPETTLYDLYNDYLSYYFASNVYTIKLKMK